MYTRNTTKDYRANNPVLSTIKDLVPSNPVLPNHSAPSTTITCKADSITKQTALAMPSTQPADTAANNFASTLSVITNTISTESTTKDYTANSPVPNNSEDLVSTKSITSTISTYNTTKSTTD